MKVKARTSEASKKASATKPKRGSVKAGLVFPPSRVGRLMRQGRFSERMQTVAPVFLAAVMEYLASEILDLAGNIALEEGK